MAATRYTLTTSSFGLKRKLDSIVKDSDIQEQNKRKVSKRGAKEDVVAAALPATPQTLDEDSDSVDLEPAEGRVVADAMDSDEDFMSVGSSDAFDEEPASSFGAGMSPDACMPFTMEDTD